ncbi:hypothetical protein [Roseateles sp. YR242]|uniref:hypothetical protein n=1 Tax=Roseateles sp. YR242 TaxID=1855305 RepID=UPI00116092BB|nr:hypothetical protein [Roseateles sp. YR242]
MTDEGHDEGSVRIVKVPEEPELHAGLVGEAYHICVISNMTRWRGLMPVHLGHLPQLIQCAIHLGPNPHLDRTPPVRYDPTLLVISLVIVPSDMPRWID